MRLPQLSETVCCPKGLLCRGPYKSMCVRPSVRPCRPCVRATKMGPELETKNRVFAMVTPSSVTNFGSERDASQFSDKKLGFHSGNAIECH